MFNMDKHELKWANQYIEYTKSFPSSSRQDFPHPGGAAWWPNLELQSWNLFDPQLFFWPKTFVYIFFYLIFFSSTWNFFFNLKFLFQPNFVFQTNFFLLRPKLCFQTIFFPTHKKNVTQKIQNVQQYWLGPKGPTAGPERPHHCSQRLQPSAVWL